MKKDKKSKAIQVTACLLSLVIVWRYGTSLEGTEFSGGWLTGPLLDMKFLGSLLFALALLLSFFYQRIAAAIALIACLFCLPLFFYFSAPGPVRSVFRRADSSVPLGASFVWDNWAIMGIIVLTITAYLGVRDLLFAGKSRSRNSA